MNNWKTARSILEIRFSQPFRELNSKSDLIRFLSGDENSAVNNEGINLRDTKNRLQIAIDARMINIAVETGKQDGDTKLLLATLKKVRNKYNSHSISVLD